MMRYASRRGKKEVLIDYLKKGQITGNNYILLPNYRTSLVSTKNT